MLELWLNSYSIFGASLIVALLLANLETFSTYVETNSLQLFNARCFKKIQHHWRQVSSETGLYMRMLKKLQIGNVGQNIACINICFLPETCNMVSIYSVRL